MKKKKRSWVSDKVKSEKTLLKHFNNNYTLVKTTATTKTTIKTVTNAK